ncbi:MAG: T9SS C-terminal target domain-containing protein [Calditrichaeota bacterium]|nr:MAG: T9SS C-terminal target domain-containing protein [Calditrichota bacterium]
MTKSYTVLFLLLFVFTAFAAKIEQKHVRNLTGNEVLPATNNSSVLHKASALDGTPLGETVYDYGTNSVMGRMLARSTNGVHAAFMKRYPDATVNREATYDFFDFAGSAFFGNFTLDPGNYTGWANVANTTGDAAVEVNHGGGVSIWLDEGEAFYTFTQDTVFNDFGMTLFPRVDAQGDVIVATANDNASAAGFVVSSDHGASWTFGLYPNVSAGFWGSAEVELLVDPTNTSHLKSAVAITDTTGAPDGLYVGESNDGGATFTYTEVVAEDFMDNGYLPFVENFAQISNVFDGTGNLHVVFNGYGVDATQDTAIVTPVMYMNDRDMTLMQVDAWGMDTAKAAQAATYFPGNGIGNAYPSVAASEDGNVVVVVWQQPEFDADGNIIFAYDASGDSTSGLMATDIYMNYSTDGGKTWNTPQWVAGNAGESDVFPSLAAKVSVDGDNYVVDLLYMYDPAPGVSLFGEGSNPLVTWLYKSIVVTATGIDDGGVVANSYELQQNYPNPFNPVTTIKYSLEKAGNVTLDVYNVLGAKVATLVNGEKMSAGAHEVTFDASNLASGIYYYKLSADGFEATKKMVLVK